MQTNKILLAEIRVKTQENINPMQVDHIPTVLEVKVTAESTSIKQETSYVERVLGKTNLVSLEN